MGTSQDNIESVVNFLRFQRPVTVAAFDELLIVAIKMLSPFYEKFLLWSEEGAVVRNNCSQIMADIYDANATAIQSRIRICLAKQRCIDSRRKILEEIKRQEELKEAE